MKKQLNDTEWEISIDEVLPLMGEGKRIFVKTKNNEFAEIESYVEKGNILTYEVILQNGNSIKVTPEHEFFTNAGWVKCKDLRINEHMILCDDNSYQEVQSINNIGVQRIVDINVNHPDHCYFGNGMLNHNSGKSLLAAHALANTQKQGGMAVYIDTENAISREFLEAIGLDLEKMLYVPLETIEDIFEAIEGIIESVRKSNKNKLVTIVVDSVMGASTKIEMAAEYDKDGYATSKSIILSKGMRKLTNMIGREKICLIFTNQLRSRLGVSFGDPWCVDPFTTKIKIRYNTNDNFIEEEITLAELADRFLHINDFDSEEIYDMSNLDIEVETLDSDNNRTFVPIKSFIVKPSVTDYYTDGKINVTGNHRFIENAQEIFAKDHPDFKNVLGDMKVVDLEIDSDDHTYLANGRLNHNTTSGGKAIPFHASVRLRLKSLGQIKAKKNGIDQIIGIQTRAQVIKNRMGPPLKSVDYDIYFESGIDNYGGWLNIMKDHNLVRQAGAWYTYTTKAGKDIKFQSKDFEKILKNDNTLHDEVYQSICNSYIFKYKPGEDFGVDDIIIDTDFTNEEA